MLGIRYPIVQGGMHYVGYAEMAAAVSNAGGLGTITALTLKSAEDLRAEIHKCRDLLHDSSTPIAVNLTLLPMLTPPDYPAYAQVVVEEVELLAEVGGLARQHCAGRGHGISRGEADRLFQVRVQAGSPWRAMCT